MNLFYFMLYLSRGDGLLEAGVWRVKDRTGAERRDKKKIAEKKGYHGHN